MKMPSITIAFGVLFLSLGLSGFWMSHAPTALIPCIWGILFFVCGSMAQNPERLKHAMHAAATLGLLGFLATVKSWFDLLYLFHGIPVKRPLAVMEKSMMAALSLVFVLLCVGSFIQARRERQAK